jgi:hypothetical protein
MYIIKNTFLTEKIPQLCEECYMVLDFFKGTYFKEISMKL